jgi:tetratricopeptide (TPR) repeat protein
MKGFILLLGGVMKNLKNGPNPIELVQEATTEIQADFKGVIDHLMDVFKTDYEESKEEPPYSEIEGEFRSGLENQFQSSIHRFLKGYALLLHDAQETQSNVYLCLGEKILEKKTQSEELEKRLTQGENLSQILGFSEAALSVFYKTALYFLEHGQYEQAGDAFFCLCLLSPNIALFWQGLARSEWALKHQEEALNAYQAALLVAGNDFSLYGEAVNCAIECKNGKKIAEFLDIAIEYAEQHPEDSSGKALQQSALKLKQEFSWLIQQDGG